MKKDLVTHFVFTVAFFLLATLIRGWTDIMFFPFWAGALLGMILPDIDYLIYIYALNPGASVSQQATNLIEKRSVVKTWDLLARTRPQHSDLIFHSALFQIIFVVFSFLIVTSSGSLFGMGVVLAFSLHLLIDQVTDLVEAGTIKNWFSGLNLDLSRNGERWWVLTQVMLLVIFGFTF